MLRSLHQWLPGYLASVLRRPPRADGARHLMFCLADHFEPFRGGAAREAARATVAAWAAAYRGAVGAWRDADGRAPQHTFFYPEEEYDRECLDALQSLCRDGLGEVEIHLHHRGDTAEGLAAKLMRFRDGLHENHGLLGVDRATGGVRYGFVHGNWALCNSRPDGDWCGVNEELGVLRRTGCYADFTFPSAPSPTQPRTVNAIYYAADRPGRPRGHDRGQRVEARGQRPEDRGQRPEVRGQRAEGEGQKSEAGSAGPLMIVQGPLALNWRRRKWGCLPRLDNGAIDGGNPPDAARVALWVRQSIHVRGRPEWVFVKVHTHGCVPGNRSVLFGPFMQRVHEFLRTAFNDGRRWRLHYATARELYNIIRAAECGATGDPAAFRDYEVAPPPCKGAKTT
jgi:hypothetical protein